MLLSGLTQAELNSDGTILITGGSSGQLRVWDGENAGLLLQGFAFRWPVESLVLGPEPRRVDICFENQASPNRWASPVPLRSLPVPSLCVLQSAKPTPKRGDARHVRALGSVL
jgi:hypothetical protein